MYSINAAALLIGAAGLLSRMLGVLRDRLLASHFGAARELDIYYAAFQIPDFLYTVFLLGAASAAIIPVLLDIQGKSQEDARRFFKDVIVFFALGSAGLSLITFFLMPFLARAIAPGFSPEETALLIHLSRIMLLSPILLGLSSVLSSAIQSARLFTTYALTGVVYNIGIIFGILVFLPRFGISGLAFGVLLGALLHVGIQVVPFWGLGFRFPYASDFFPHRFGRFFRGAVASVIALSFPRVLALSLRQITFIVYVALASTLLSGSIAVLQLAYNLQYIPVGIFGLSFAVAAFPQLTEQWMLKNPEKWAHTFAESLRTIVFWVAPLSILFYVLRAQIVRVALGGGKFDWDDTILTAAVFGVFSVAIIAESLIPFLIRSFHSIGNTRVPFFVAVLTSGLSILSAFGLVSFFEHGSPALIEFTRNLLKVGDTEGIHIIGLSWAFIVGGIGEATLLLVLLGVRIRRQFGTAFSIPIDWMDFFRIGWVSLLSGLVAFGTLRTVNTVVSLDTFVGVFVQGASAFIAGALVYAVVLYLLGNEDIRNILETSRRRLFRRDILPQELDAQDSKEAP